MQSQNKISLKKDHAHAISLATYLKSCNNEASELIFQNSSYFVAEKFHGLKNCIFQCLGCSWVTLSL